MALRKFLFMSAEGYAQEQAATDELQLGKVTLSGISGVAIDGGGQLASNFADPVSGTDLATKQYVDSVATGLNWKQHARVATTANLSVTAAGSGVGKTLTATANGAIVIDGVTLALNDRVLVKDQTTQSDNGIYTVTQTGSAGSPYILTRATDADQNAEVTAGMALFVTEGTVNADEGWVQITPDPITVDTSALVFAQFSSTVSYTFDQGLSLTSGSVKVELDTTANTQGAGAGGGSSGLEFDVNTAAGKLRAAVNPTGGLQRSATGLAALLADTTLSSGASGLSVVKAPKEEITTTADEAIPAGNPVAWSSVTNDRVVNGRADTDAKARVIGVARTAAAGAGNSLDVTASGIVTGILSGATVGTPYYLPAAGGSPTATVPGGGNRVIQVGIAKNATDLWVRVIDYGKKA